VTGVREEYIQEIIIANHFPSASQNTKGQNNYGTYNYKFDRYFVCL
jgi:hypothetical protein